MLQDDTLCYKAQPIGFIIAPASYWWVVKFGLALPFNIQPVVTSSLNTAFQSKVYMNEVQRHTHRTAPCIRTWLHCISEGPTGELRTVLLRCRRLLLSKPCSVGEINSPKHTGIQTADVLMWCQPHGTYRSHDSEHWSGMIHCIAKNSLKANKRQIQQTLSQGLHWITPLNQSIKLHSSINICQGVPIKRFRVLTSVQFYLLISSHQGHSHTLSLQLLWTPSRNDGNRHWQISGET